jgi:5-formyltetrahydrofolate cyclo-ligase
MPEETILEQKKSIREEYRKLRAALDDSYRRAAAKNILENFDKLVMSKDNIDTIGLYWPVDFEIDLMPLVKKFNLHGLKCALPRISGDNMDFILYTENSTMQKSQQLSFYEPTGSEIALPDILAVPLLACDTQRNRIGYGKGFYDRYLRQHKSFSVGVAYDTLLRRNTLPQEDHDAQLDAILTESRFLI